MPTAKPPMPPATPGRATRTRPRRRGSDRSRATALPAASGAVGLRLRLAQPQAQAAEILSGAGRSRSRRSVPAVRRRRSRRTRRSGCRCRRRNPPTRRRSPPAMAGTVVGQPPRKRLKVDDDPFGAVGDYAGSFLIKSAVELSAGYDTNPAPHRGARRLAVLCDRAGISGRLRLGAPRAGRRPARLLHRLRQHLSAADRRHGLVGAGQYRSSGFHRPCRRPARRHQRHPAAGAGAAAGRDRQSRQPEHPGRPRQISDLYHVRRHLRRRPELQPPADLRRRHRRPHRLSRTRSSPTAPPPPTTTATSTSSAASAASATT